jgi:hypothetical protein
MLRMRLGFLVGVLALCALALFFWADSPLRPKHPEAVTIQGDAITFTLGATDEDMAILDGYPNLKKVSISGPDAWSGGDPASLAIDITDTGFAHIAKCKNLEVLIINTWFTHKITDAGLVHAGKLSKLKEIELNSQFSDAGVAHFAGLENVEVLTLHFNKNIGDGAMAVAGGFKKLEETGHFSESGHG